MRSCRTLLALCVTACGCGEYFRPAETRFVADAAPSHPSDVPAVPMDMVFHGCTTERFADRSYERDDRTVTFGSDAMGASPLSFNPKCISIAAGQSVTFRGPFQSHPLSAGESASARMAGSPGTPIPNSSTSNVLVVRFPAPGVFPYFCTQHGFAGMAGVVHVRPAS